MKDYEKAIEEAAIHYSAIIESVSTQDFNEERCIDDYTEGAKSEAAKAFHQQGMYSEEEVKVLLKQYFWWQWDNELSDDGFEEWFGENKKKEPTKTVEECPIGSYEEENKVADCVGSGSCRELCKTCINYTK